ncbi:toll-like receptor 4 [Leptopilina boulardi]|uniref:toll-like receptor 4 n=1 Tax=Leptopilina boulardi TaxID=63433 RepID=UPI0021F52DD7|nr:toll-like receptor 4 [Leptopilina boulardi]
MNLFIFHGLILFGFSMTIMPETFALKDTWSQSMLSNSEIPPKKCRYFKDKTMLTCNCQNLSFDKIPQNLQTSIEILDFSYNRLVDISKDTFSRFTNLKFLDLKDNFLQGVEDGAFDPLQELMVLDLSRTISITLPKGLLSLPRLEKLYIEDNKLTESVFESQIVTSPLKIIHAVKNSFKKFPNLGPLPNLFYLNISENQISKINVDNIAPLCKLQILDLTNNPISFDEATCDCQHFNIWIKQHNITVLPHFKCSNKFDLNCSENFNNRTMSLYQECEEIIKEKIKSEKAKSTWTLVISCVAGSLICIFFILYCIHRRNKKRHRKLKKAQQLASNNANTELLNSNLQEQT